MDTVTAVIATYGDESWAELAAERAIPSVDGQVPWIHVHGDTLHDARNAGLAQVATPDVVHLDADDELEPGFFDAIAKSDADLRAPAVRYVRNNRPRQAAMPRVAGHTHDCTTDCLPEGNWLVVGTVAPAHLLRDVGGWEAWPVYEDWAIWLRCWLAGATVEAVPEAVYRAYWRVDSRNRGPAPEFKERTHHAIADAILPDHMRVAA